MTVELSQAGYDVVIADNMSNCDETNYEGVCRILGRKLPLVKMDFCDSAAVGRLFADYHIDAVIHFAAFKAVGESVSEPLKYYRNNLESFPQHRGGGEAPGRLQHSVLIVRDGLRSGGETSRDGADAASAGHLSLRQHQADMRGRAQGQRACLQGSQGHSPCAISTPIGAHPSALIGELPRGVPNNLVPFITQTAIGQEECLSVFGNDYDTPDGTCLRDYIDIVDLAKAHVARFPGCWTAG